MLSRRSYDHNHHPATIYVPLGISISSDSKQLPKETEAQNPKMQIQKKFNKLTCSHE